MEGVTFARWLFVGFFALLLLGVLALPKDYVFRGAPDRAVWRDLRLWAIVLVLIHTYVYLAF